MPSPRSRALPSEAARPSLVDRLEYAFFSLAFGLFAALPRRAAVRLGAWVGELFYLADVRDRQVALLNLSIAFPDKTLAERQRILRASSRNLGRTAAEICHLPRLDLSTLPQYVSFADRTAWEHTIERAAHSGTVILTAHFGNWELLAYAQGLLGHPITLVHRPMRNALVEAAITALRSRAGTQAINKLAAARAALRVLKNGGMLVIPSDQNQRYSFGVFIELFGKLACTNPGAARLAMLTGAPVVPVFLVRDGESERHRIEVLPDVEMITTGDRDADIRTNTQRCSNVIEDMLRRYPEQWIWFHKRWKTRPVGEPAVYS